MLIKTRVHKTKRTHADCSCIAGPGREANESTLSSIINAAASDFGDLDQAQQPVYARAFGQFIYQLDPASANQSTLLGGLTNSIVFVVTAPIRDDYASYNGEDYTGPLIVLTHVAGLHESCVRAYQQVQLQNQSIGWHNFR